MNLDRRLTIGVVLTVAVQTAGVLLWAGVQASWVRRGRDIADSWTFPEAPNEGRFVAEFDSGAGFGGRIELDAPACAVPPGTVSMRVAEKGPDGRTGPWLSIGPGSPYL